MLLCIFPCLIQAPPQTDDMIDSTTTLIVLFPSSTLTDLHDVTDYTELLANPDEFTMILFPWSTQADPIDVNNQDDMTELSGFIILPCHNEFAEPLEINCMQTLFIARVHASTIPPPLTY